MIWYYITFRSVTVAQRGEEVLRKNGINCNLQRTPRWMEQQGRGYCLKVQKVRQAIDALGRNQVPYKKLYREENGKFREVTV